MGDADDYVTFAEAAAAVAVPAKTVAGWADGGRVRTRYVDRRDRATPRHPDPMAVRLVSLASVRAYAARMNEPVPAGHVTVAEAARLLRVTPAMVRNRAYAGALRSVSVRRNGQPTRYVLAADCVPPPPPPPPPPPEPDDREPVLYGLLTARDVRELERRRARAA